jgi:spermidine synthase
MKKWNILERTKTPDGQDLTLSEHDGELVLRVNGRELMSSMRTASEVRLGELGGLHLAARGGGRALIGGLGLGFTLKAVLASAPASARVVVAELLPEIVAWNEDPSRPLAATQLADARTELVLGDVFALIDAASRTGSRQFDAIMLDADNGTTAMMSQGNRRLYDLEGIRRVRDALASGGLAIYWSAAPEPALEKAMKRLGFKVEVEMVRAYGHGGARHYLVIGRRSR